MSNYKRSASDRMRNFVLQYSGAMIHPLFLNLGTGEVFIIVLVIVMFFGSDKLPEMVRSFTRGMNEMKNATSEIQREIQKGANDIAREVNAQGHLDDLKAAADDLSKRITDGVKTDEDITPPRPEEDPNNPLNPDSSVKREV